MWGSRVSLEIGFVATALSLVVGTVVGSVAGYFGRGVDTAVMRAADAFLSVPALFLILIVVALFGASLRNTALVIALVTWAPVARVVRAECLSLRAREFVHAAHALGAGHVRILGRHVLVNALPVVIVQASLLLGQTHPHRVRAQLPRAGRSASATELGQHGGRGPTVPGHRLVDRGVSRPGHLRDRARLQPVRRRATRRIRSRPARLDVSVTSTANECDLIAKEN